MLQYMTQGDNTRGEDVAISYGHAVASARLSDELCWDKVMDG